MRCPYCRSPLTELAPECPQCRLNLNRVASLVGPVPRITPGISDSTGAITRREAKRLLKRVERIRQRFPQIRIQILVHHFPQNHPFELHVFWIFNLGGLFRDNEKAGENHTVLIALDPIANQSSVMVGYGLEPFITVNQLDEILEPAVPAWSDRAWAEGLEIVLDELEPLLEQAIQDALAAFDFTAASLVPAPGDF